MQSSSSLIQDLDQTASIEQRRHRRYAVRMEIVLHARGRSQPATINDVSTGGAGIEGVIGIYEDDSVEFEVEAGRRIPGTIVWWISGCCGVQFDQPLNHDDPLLIAARAQSKP